MSLVEHPNLFAAICVLGLKATRFEWWGGGGGGTARITVFRASTDG